MTKHIELAIADLVQKRHSLPYVRSKSIDDIAKQIKSTFSGVFLIEGTPGIGKSASLGPITDVVGAHNPDRIISYYFSLTDPVLNNADNFYEYACERIKAIIDVPTAEKETVLAKGARKDHIDFQHALAELAEFIGNDVERRIYFFIDGIEEIQDHREFLGRLPYIDGVIYVLFAQPGICDGALPDRFYERGRLKNRSAIKYLEKSHAESFFWEVYGKELDDKRDVYEERIYRHLISYLEVETNRFPLLLKVLAEDTRNDGFNPDRAWASGLQDYVDSRISALSENAKNLLILVSLALGPLQCEDLCEMMGNLSRATYEAALKEAERFLIINMQGITISHHVWAKLVSKRWANKTNYEVYLNWCAKWNIPGLRQEAAVYIAQHYMLHILDFADRWNEPLRAEELLRELYKEDSTYLTFQSNTLIPSRESWSGILAIYKKVFKNVSSSRGYTPELITSILWLFCKLEGLRRKNSFGEIKHAFDEFEKTNEVSEIGFDLAESLRVMQGVEQGSLRQNLKYFKGPGKKWDATQMLYYVISREIFKDTPSEENKIVIFDWLSTFTMGCLKEDFKRLTELNPVTEVELIYTAICNWTNISKDFNAWTEMLKKIKKPEVKFLLERAETVVQGINMLLKLKATLNLEEGSASPSDVNNKIGTKLHNLKKKLAAIETFEEGMLAELVIKFKNEKDENARCRAIVCFTTKPGRPDVVTVLSQALTCDESVLVRRAAADALIKIGDSTSFESLIHALWNDADVQVQTSSAKALGEIGDACAQGPLIAALSNSSDEVRQAAKIALGKLKPLK